MRSKGGEAHRARVTTRFSSEVTRDAARRRAPAGLQRVLDYDDAMTGTRTTRRARERESPPRSLPDEEVEDGWRSFGLWCATGR
jgi:hypothetical protein